MSDSDFDPRDVIAVFGERPRCHLTGLWQWVDKSHIFGRGGAHDQVIHSSIYNCAPLSRDIHKFGYRDHPLMRVLLLTITFEKVQEAINRGNYTQTDNDREFIERYHDWYTFPWDSLPRIA